jgi:hypothetical protein
MNVLDESVPRDQADLLRLWGVRFRLIAGELAQPGIADEDIVPLLRRLKQPTLLSRDGDFFDRKLAHPRYSLVFFDVLPAETAFFIRRFLRHRLFRTSSQRLGKVIRVQSSHIEYWTRTAERPMTIKWE